MSIPLTDGQVAMKNILTILEEKGIKKAHFAEKMGVESAYVSNWKRRGIPLDRLPRAADVLSVTVDELLNRVVGIPNAGMPVLLTGRIPVIGRAKLGSDGYFAEIYSDVQEDGYLPIPSDDAQAYALRCEGTSMMPRIQPGEYVIAEPSQEAKPGDEVVVQDIEGRAMVKRLLYIRDENVFLGSVNELHDTIVIPQEQIRSIHPVLAIVPKKLWRPC